MGDFWIYCLLKLGYTSLNEIVFINVFILFFKNKYVA